MLKPRLLLLQQLFCGDGDDFAIAQYVHWTTQPCRLFDYFADSFLERNFRALLKRKGEDLGRNTVSFFHISQLRLGTRRSPL